MDFTKSNYNKLEPFDPKKYKTEEDIEPYEYGTEKDFTDFGEIYNQPSEKNDMSDTTYGKKYPDDDNYSFLKKNKNEYPYNSDTLFQKTEKLDSFKKYTDFREFSSSNKEKDEENDFFKNNDYTKEIELPKSTEIYTYDERYKRGYKKNMYEMSAKELLQSLFGSINEYFSDFKLDAKDEKIFNHQKTIINYLKSKLETMHNLNEISYNIEKILEQTNPTYEFLEKIIKKDGKEKNWFYNAINKMTKFTKNYENQFEIETGVLVGDNRNSNSKILNDIANKLESYGFDINENEEHTDYVLNVISEIYKDSEKKYLIDKEFWKKFQEDYNEESSDESNDYI